MAKVQEEEEEEEEEIVKEETEAGGAAGPRLEDEVRRALGEYRAEAGPTSIASSSLSLPLSPSLVPPLRRRLEGWTYRVGGLLSSS